MKNNNKISKNNKLLALNPFLDKTEILRACSRFNKSLLNFNRKHPIILPASNKFVELMGRRLHLKYFHAGYDFIINCIRQKYWIVGGV